MNYERKMKAFRNTLTIDQLIAVSPLARKIATSLVLNWQDWKQNAGQPDHLHNKRLGVVIYCKDQRSQFSANDTVLINIALLLHDYYDARYRQEVDIHNATKQFENAMNPPPPPVKKVVEFGKHPHYPDGLTEKPPWT